jgi:hypothetical protein
MVAERCMPRRYDENHIKSLMQAIHYKGSKGIRGPTTDMSKPFGSYPNDYGARISYRQNIGLNKLRLYKYSSVPSDPMLLPSSSIWFSSYRMIRL